jgi:hypothetical protein
MIVASKVTEHRMLVIRSWALGTKDIKWSAWRSLTLVNRINYMLYSFNSLN